MYKLPICAHFRIGESDVLIVDTKIISIHENAKTTTCTYTMKGRIHVYDCQNALEIQGTNTKLSLKKFNITFQITGIFVLETEWLTVPISDTYSCSLLNDGFCPQTPSIYS